MTQQMAVREEVSPEQFDRNIEAAQHKARSLKHIVDSQGLSVRIGTSEHLKVEAWLTIAAGYGYSPRIAWSRPLPDGGYEAHAELVDSIGTVVGAGEAECGTDGDDNWLDKPAFQQRSMAQTRATVRACRNKLAWVVILAGYSPTPAEEMVGEQHSTPKDNRFYCAEHRATWTKRTGRDGASWYSHKQGDGWCNMKDAKLASPDEGESPRYNPSDGESTMPVRHAGKDITDDEWQTLYDWAAEKYGIEKPEGVHMLLGKPASEWTGTLRDAAALIQAGKEQAAKVQ